MVSTGAGIRTSFPQHPNEEIGFDNGPSMKGTLNLKLQITIDGKVYEVGVEVLEDDGAPRLPAYTPYQPAPTQNYAPAAEDNYLDANVCRSPVTGIVIKVNVQPGQAVQAGDQVMVLEAMKMENSVTAHRAGTVRSVSVAAGDSVKVNQMLVEFEA